MKKLWVTFYIAFFWLLICKALPEGPFPDAVFNPNIKTVQFYRQGWEFSFPIKNLNDELPLEFSFDDLNSEQSFYNYVVVLCDADWNPSRLTFSDYLDGFYQNTLSSWEPSFNTHVSYRHYSLQLPNENVKFKISGNYILLVYTDDENSPSIIKRFVVTENAVDISATAHRPTLTTYQKKYQEVDFSVLNPNFVVDNPYQSVKVAIVKNNQWKFAINDLKPLFVRDKELIYNYEDKNIFPGGNEYRSFTTKNLKYYDVNIQNIKFNGQFWEVTLLPDVPRDRAGYSFMEDLNGRYLIENKQGQSPALDADYVQMNFALKLPEPVVDGDIYVWGGFSDFNCYPDYKMKYNFENSLYELSVRIKQGYFNYQYVYVPRKTIEPDDQYFEGSYSETENTYVIYIYYRPFGARWDRVIGVQTVKSW